MARWLVGLLLAVVLTAVQQSGADFVPDTTGLYERRGEVKYSVEYYQQFTPKGTKEKSLVRPNEVVLGGDVKTMLIFNL